MNETENIIYQNSDEDVEFNLVDDGGNALDLSAAAKIYVFIYTRGSLAPALKFSLTAATGYIVFVPSGGDLAAGIVRTKLLSSMTSALEAGKYFAEIGVQFPDVTRTDDSLFDVIVKDIYSFTIKKSLTKVTTLP